MRKVMYYTRRVLKSPLSFSTYCKRRGERPDAKNRNLVLDYLEWVAKVQDLELR